MPRIATALLAGAVSLSAVTAVQAGWFGDCGRVWHINNMWPEPYIGPDRWAVKQPICIMQQRGWQRYHLLGEHHFELDQKRLTPAGQLRVKSILMNSPPEYRTVFVEKGANVAITEQRIGAVQQALVDLAPEGGLPPVLASNMVVEGWSSEYADAVGRKFMSAIPQPRLTGAAAASSGGGGGGGSGN